MDNLSLEHLHDILFLTLKINCCMYMYMYVLLVALKVQLIILFDVIVCYMHFMSVITQYDLYILLSVAMEAIAVKLFDKLLVLLSDKVHVSCIVAMVTHCN